MEEYGPNIQIKRKILTDVESDQPLPVMSSDLQVSSGITDLTEKQADRVTLSGVWRLQQVLPSWWVAPCGGATGDGPPPGH